MIQLFRRKSRMLRKTMDIVMIKLRVFMRIHILENIIKKVKSR